MSINYPESRNDRLDAYRAQVGVETTHAVYQFDWENPHDFTTEQRYWIGLGINSMCALGPTCVWDTRLKHAAKVVVARWPDDNSTNPVTDKTPNAGRTIRMPDGSWRIEFDPVGLHGEAATIFAAAHETGHVFELDHLDPKAHGPAIMNPTIPELTFRNDTSADMDGTLPPAGPTRADFAEYDRVHPETA